MATLHQMIGQRIETRRKELNLTLSDVASAVGVAASTIQRYEKGQFEKIKKPVIDAISHSLYVNPEWLLCRTDDPIDYDGPSFGSDIPGSYLEACDGDARRAYKMMLAAHDDAEKENGFYFHRPDVLDEVDVSFYDGYKSLDDHDKEVLRDMVRVMREKKIKNQE